LIRLEERREEVTFFEKKVTKKTLIPPAFERPQYGRSTAGNNQKFFGYFFSKK